MELKDFFKLLKKYILVLIIVPIITVIVAYFLVRKLPKDYISSGKISTGITDNSRALIDPLAGGLQESKVNGQFSNLLEMMKLKKMWDMLSYKLVIHDLNDNNPFRSFNSEYIHIEPAKRLWAIGIFSDKLKKQEPLDLSNDDQKWLHRMLETLGYDQVSLEKTVDINREESSDFVSVTAKTENSQLSAFMVNTYIQGFIQFYTENSQQNQTASIEFLTKLLDEKRHTLDSVTKALQDYKIANNVLNLEEQSKSIQSQKSATADMLLLMQRQADAYRGAIQRLEKNFTPATRSYAEAGATKLNVNVITTQDKLHALIDVWTRSGFNARYDRSIDSMKKLLTEQINTTSDNYVSNPLIGKDDQRKKLAELQVEYDQAYYSQGAIQRQLNNLDREFNKLVPLDANIKTFNFALDNATKEYQDILNKFNQSNLQSTANSKLLQIVMAVPEVAQKSKQNLLIALAGILSFVFCMVVMFILWYMDDAINNPIRLANATNLPVLGTLNKLPGNSIDLRRLWDGDQRDKMQLFKDLLRSVRFEVDQELGDGKILAITSMREGEGKTLFAISLAYSYAMINKKVLLIDGNYENPTITRSVHPDYYIEDILKNAAGGPRLTPNTNVLGNHGGDVTLLEISDEKAIREKLTELKTTYDIIIIEAPSLAALSKAKEWFVFADKIVAVFEANQSIFNGKKIIIKYFQGTGEKFSGWILNKLTAPVKKRHH